MPAAKSHKAHKKKVEKWYKEHFGFTRKSWAKKQLAEKIARHIAKDHKK